MLILDNPTVFAVPGRQERQEIDWSCTWLAVVHIWQDSWSAHEARWTRCFKWQAGGDSELAAMFHTVPACLPPPQLFTHLLLHHLPWFSFHYWNKNVWSNNGYLPFSAPSNDSEGKSRRLLSSCSDSLPSFKGVIKIGLFHLLLSCSDPLQNKSEAKVIFYSNPDCFLKGGREEGGGSRGTKERGIWCSNIALFLLPYQLRVFNRS